MKFSEFRFSKAAVLNPGRTELAEMIKVKDMLSTEAWEDTEGVPESGGAVSTEALPQQVPTSGDMSHATGPRNAKRMEHLGVDACDKLIEAVINKNEDITVWCYVSLNPGAGYELESFLKKRASATKACTCFAVVESDNQTDALKASLIAGFTTKMMTGTLKVPGVPAPEKQALEADPVLEAPVVHTLKYYNGMAKVPQAIYSKWAMDERFCEQFKQCLTKAQHDLGYSDPLEILTEETEQKSPGKRAGDPVGVQPSPKKVIWATIEICLDIQVFDVYLVGQSQVFEVPGCSFLVMVSCVLW